jgi:hypothetical protein
MALVAEMGYDVYKELYDSQILQMPYVYKHYIDKNEDEESFGIDGSETKELIRRHRDTMAFWSEADADDTIKTDGILLLSMHGSDLMDNEKLVPTIIHMFDFDNENDILDFANKVREYVEGLPGGYNNPLLTMNAVATRGGGRGNSPTRTVASLVIGDGVLQFVKDSNLSSSGPDFVHAHEFGHHLQYEMDLAHNVPAGFENDIRRKEIMADALSAYFLAHDRGGNMDPHEISEFSMTAFATGDCNTGEEDHHGTPKQRYCASVWGASRAALASDDAPLIDPETFVQMFNKAYGGILELNGNECTLVLEEPDEDVSASAVSSNFDTSNVDTSNLGVQTYESPSVEVSFSDEDYETTDGAIATGASGYSVPEVHETAAVEPPHETIGLPAVKQPESFEKESMTHVSENKLDEVENNGKNEALILVAGHPSETKVHDLSGDNIVYACNLPWVYCSDELKSSGMKAGGSRYQATLILIVCNVSLFTLRR